MNAKNKQQGLLILGVVVAAAVIVFVIAIAASGNAAGQSFDYASLSPSRTADGAFVIGDPNAPVTLIEFADFGCPHCQTYHTTMQRFIREHVVTGQARFEFRIFPTAGGQTTVFAGQLAECADDQQAGMFWKVYDRFFELARTGRYNEDFFRPMIQELGLNYTEILECSSEANQVVTDVNFGQTQGVNGTPAVMVRYGDGPAQWISIGGVTYDRGSVDYSVLSAVVQQANAG